MDIETPNETDTLQPLKQVMGQSGAVMAFLALRSEDGSFSIRSVSDQGSDTPWSNEGLQSWAQSAWDDPLLRHGSIIVCVDAVAGDGFDAGTPFTVAAAPLVEGNQTEHMRGLLCIINSANAPFSQQQVDSLAEGARWFNSTPGLCESVVGVAAPAPVQAEESFEGTPEPTAEPTATATVTASDGPWLASLVGEDQLTKVPGPVPFLRIVAENFQKLNDESELSIFLVNVTPAEGSEIPELLLVGLANRLTGELRTADVVGRVGPSTFAAMVVTPMGMLAASSIAHRLQGAMEEVAGDAQGAFGVRSSIATQNSHGERNAEELFRHAVDRLLA